MNPLLILAAAVVVFLIWRRQQEDQAAQALGWRPAPGGADGSPQSQNAAAHGGSPVVGNSQQNITHGLESAFGAGACVAAGAAPLAPLCAALAPTAVGVLKKVAGPHYIIGRGPPTEADIRRILTENRLKETADYVAAMGGDAGGRYTEPDKDTLGAHLILSAEESAAYAAAIGGKNPFVPPGFGIPKLVPAAKGPAVQSRTGRGHF